MAEVLVYALDHQLHGTLVLQGSNGDKNALYFVRGSPSKARLVTDKVLLSEIVVDLGLLDRLTSTRTQQRAIELGKTQAEVLLEERVVDETSLYLALREQLNRQVLFLCKTPTDTNFGIYDANLLAKWGAPGEWRVKPLPLIWRALVDTVPDDKVQKVLAQVGERPLHLRFEAPVSRYRMIATESSLVDLLRARAQTVGSLRDSGVGKQAFVERVVAALVFSRQLEGLSDDREPVGSGEPPETPASLPPPSQGRGTSRASSLAGPRFEMDSAAPGSLTPSGLPRSATPPIAINAPARSLQPTKLDTPRGPNVDTAELRADIEAQRDHPAVTYYDLLGIPKEADAAVVRAAFFRLARRWHPDRLPADLEDLRPTVTKTFARMSEANQMLSDAARRAEYDKALLEAPDDEQEKVLEILEASSAYQRAEILMKKRDLVGALAQARAAYEGDTEQADYVALYAWLESTQRTSGYEDLVKLLDHAVQLEPMNVRALWYRGQLLKKMGKIMPSVRDFKAIMELKPNHTDALRELRVYDMRRRTDTKTARPAADPADRRTTGVTARPAERRSTSTAPKPGLFGRFLKKD